MLALGPSTSDLVRVVTGTTGADIEPSISYVTYSNATPPVVQLVDGEPLPSITTNTNTNLLTGASSTYTVIKGINLANRGSTTTSVSVEHLDASDTVQLIYCTLLQNESLVYTESGLWLHYDANGAVYPSTGNAASQAEMEAGTATDKYVTPQSVNWHPGATKCWGKAVGAGTSLTVNWNITSVSDTGTGRLGVNIATDFSSAHYSVVASLERSVTALTATGVEDHAIRNASPAAGSFEIESYDQTAITFVAQDPTSYFWQCCGDQ